MTPLFRIFQFSLGRRPRQRSAVFTIKKRTYQVCLKCGQEFEYSRARMHAVRPSVADSLPLPLPLDHVKSNLVRPNNARPNETPVSSFGRETGIATLVSRSELSCSDAKVPSCHSCFS